MFDWDDLRVFAVAARAGSFSAASQQLAIDAATVGRRIQRLETALKSILVIRSPSGLELTATGAQLLEKAAEAEVAMASAARITERDIVAGTIRISAAEGFGVAVLAPALPKLAAQSPRLRVELAAQAGFFSTSRREVDMAITLSASQTQRAVVEPLTRYQLALYAAPSYLTATGVPQSIDDLHRLQVVGYVDDMLYAPELRYLDEVSPGLRPVLASSSIQAQRAIVAGGGGVGVLPCFLAGGLVRVLEDDVLLERRFWLSTHEDVHGTARVRTFRSWLAELTSQSQSTLSPF